MSGRTWELAVVLVAAAFGQSDEAPGRDQGRSMVITKLGIVATSQTLASQAGAAILEQGGNAVDGWSGKGYTLEFLASRGVKKLDRTSLVHMIRVPGTVAGWEALRSRFGKLPLARLLAHAIHYAEEGFPVTELIATAWAGAASRTRRVSGRPIFQAGAHRGPGRCSGTRTWGVRCAPSPATRRCSTREHWRTGWSDSSPRRRALWSRRTSPSSSPSGWSPCQARIAGGGCGNCHRTVRVSLRFRY